MPPLLDDSRAEDVIGNTDNLGIVLGQVSADARPDSFVLGCFFGRLVGIEHEREAMIPRANIDNRDRLRRIADLPKPGRQYGASQTEVAN